MTNQVKRAACFDVPAHHADLWHEYATNDAPIEVSRVLAAGEAKAHGFDAFATELHHRLYSETPREIAADERSSAAAVRARLHDLASDLPEMETLRRMTTRDPLWSGMATSILSDSIASALPPKSSAIEDDADKAAAAIAAGAIDDSRVRTALREGIADAEAQIDTARAAMSALGWGEGTGSHGAACSPAVAIQVARRVASSETLKRVIEIAGRMTLTARAKRASRTEYARSEIVGVEPTRDLGRILPTELGSLATPIGTAYLYSRLTNGAALGYKLAGKEKESRGPIIVVIDQSGSMEGPKDAWAKGVALAILDTARADNRSFGVILYDGSIRASKLFPKAKEADPRALLDLIALAPMGGTNFDAPLVQAIAWIEGSADSAAFRRADIVHVTDGHSSTAGSEAFLARCDKAGAHVYGVAIGTPGPAIASWSHDVATINDVTADSKAVDLIFDAL